MRVFLGYAAQNNASKRLSAGPYVASPLCVLAKFQLFGFETEGRDRVDRHPSLGMFVRQFIIRLLPEMSLSSLYCCSCYVQHKLPAYFYVIFMPIFLT